MQSSHDHEPSLTALRLRFPGWDIHRDFAGWVAIPVGTPVIMAMYLESLAEKIAAAACHYCGRTGQRLEMSRCAS